MIVTTNIIEDSIRRLTFDPKTLSQQIKGHSPIENETPERAKLRVKVARAQGPNALERVLGKSDLLAINYLEQGFLAARAVARLHVPNQQLGGMDYATGFLISPRLLMTNHHVFATAAEARKSRVEFGYEYPVGDRAQPLPGVIFTLRPEEFFFAHRELDFAVVAVSEAAIAGDAKLQDIRSSGARPPRRQDFSWRVRNDHPASRRGTEADCPAGKSTYQDRHEDPLVCYGHNPRLFWLPCIQRYLADSRLAPFRCSPQR